MNCTQCGDEITPWVVKEFYSGKLVTIDHSESGLCNRCYLGVNGILDYYDLDEMYKYLEREFTKPTFEAYLDSIPGLLRIEPNTLFVDENDEVR